MGSHEINISCLSVKKQDSHGDTSVLQYQRLSCTDFFLQDPDIFFLIQAGKAIHHKANQLHPAGNVGFFGKGGLPWPVFLILQHAVAPLQAVF